MIHFTQFREETQECISELLWTYSRLMTFWRNGIFVCLYLVGIWFHDKRSAPAAEDCPSKRANQLFLYVYMPRTRDSLRMFIHSGPTSDGDQKNERYLQDLQMPGEWFTEHVVRWYTNRTRR